MKLGTLENGDMGKRKLALFGYGLGALILAGGAGLDTAGAQFVGACEADIAAHCENVEPGEGRIVACLYAHEDQLSDACAEASAEHITQIDVALARVRHVLQQCAGDIHNLCTGTEAGEGRIIGCLLDHQADLTGECKQIVDQAEANLAR